MENAVGGIGAGQSELLRELAESLEKLGEQDAILQREEARIGKARDALKPEKERLGRILEQAGLTQFYAGDYKIEQGTTIKASEIDDPIEKEKMVQWFKDKDLYHKYVKVDGRSITRLYNEYKEAGDTIPGLKTTEIWACKITKG